MVKGEWDSGVLKQLANINFGDIWRRPLAKSADVQQQGRQSVPTGQNEIESLKNELEALELVVGKLIVERERYWHKTRLKTIAKLQLQIRDDMPIEQWLREARSLSRYFGTVEVGDAAIAQQMLRPYLPQSTLR